MTRHLALILCLGFVLSACGGGTESSAVASLNGETGTTAADDEDAGEVDSEAAVMALTECLREQGIDIDDPTVDADGNVRLAPPRVGESNVRGELRGAMEACQEFLEGVTLGFGRGAGGDSTEADDLMLEFAACMRDNGVDMPDPDFSATGPGGDADAEGDGAGPGGGPFGDIDRDDPDFRAAQEACQDILAGFGPGGGRLGAGPGGGDDG